MKRQAMMASLMTLALLVSPLGRMGGLTRVNAEEQPEAEPYSVSGNTQETGTMPAPTQVQFHDNYRCGYWWENTTNDFIYYVNEIVLEKDGAVLWSGTMLCGAEPGNEFSDQPLAQYMEETGSYQLHMRIMSKDGQEVSEWSSSPVVEYTRPEQTLGTTVGHWDEERKGLFHYPAVKDAAGYQWRLLKWDEGSGQWVTKWQHWEPGTWTSGGVAFDDVGLKSPTCAGGEDMTRNFSYEINTHGPGRYRVAVRALSGNIDVTANGAEGEMSDVLEISGGGQSAPAPTLVESRVAAAESGSVVKITKEDHVNALSNADMKELLKKGDVSLEMEYTYEGVDYRIYIPAGSAMDNDIPWYGPLYLAQYYSVNNSPDLETSSYVAVRRGDTLSKIAHANGMTMDELTAKNPQIKNPNKIIPGQIVYIN